VSKHKTKDEEHKLLFWELDGSDAPKYTIKANPKLTDSYIKYSPDEELFAVDAGKSVQVYQSKTGQKKGEVLSGYLPDYWLADNQILVNVSLAKLSAYNLSNGGKIYENPLIYDSYESVTSSSTDANGNTTDSTETIITDRTTVVPHPTGNVFLTHSNQFVRLYKQQNGELLETIVRPPFSLVKQKYAVREKRYVSDAGWSENGNIIFVVDHERTSISLWDFK
jgi:WD40 repeat protein